MIVADVEEVLRRRMSSSGERQVLVAYSDPLRARDWLPQDALPDDMFKAINPDLSLVTASAFKDLIQFDWVKQGLIARRDDGEQKSFSFAQWRGAATAERAALKWVSP